MLISYYANKKSSPRLPSWQPSLISFNTPIESGSIIKPCTLKHFQVPILAPGLQGENIITLLSRVIIMVFGQGMQVWAMRSEKQHRYNILLIWMLAHGICKLFGYIILYQRIPSFYLSTCITATFDTLHRLIVNLSQQDSRWSYTLISLRTLVT